MVDGAAGSMRLLGQAIGSLSRPDSRERRVGGDGGGDVEVAVSRPTETRSQVLAISVVNQS